MTILLGVGTGVLAGPTAAQQSDPEERPERLRLPSAEVEEVRGEDREKLPRNREAGRTIAPTRPQPGAHPVVQGGADLTGVTEGSSSFGDVDNDGNLDLVITGIGTATLYLGDGQGGFTEANAGLTGVQFGCTSAFEDVNGDGNLDLLITGDAGTRDDSSPSTTLYMGDGEGGFTEADAGLIGVRYGSSSFGDVNEDGAVDLLITGDPGYEATATLYLGNGEGGFREAGAGLTAVKQSSSTIGDVNGDGHLDLVITGQSEHGTPMATVYLGNGKGEFSEADAGLTGVWQSASALGDLNADGHLDLVVTGRKEHYRDTAILYFGNGEGQFTEADVELQSVHVGSVSLGDVDGNGHLDLLITGMDGSRRTWATLYLGTGEGDFTEAEAGLTGVGRSSSTFGDVNGDGTLDLVITGSPGGSETAKLYLGDGQGGFSAADP